MNTEQSTVIDPAQVLQLVPPNLQRQPEKPLTGLCTFLQITMLSDDHPHLTYFPIKIPMLNGPIGIPCEDLCFAIAATTRTMVLF